MKLPYMVNVKKTHPTLYWAIVAICVFDLAVGLSLAALPDVYFSATRGPAVVTEATNQFFGLLVALPGVALIPGVFLRIKFRTVQKILIFDLAVWVFFSLASFGTVILGNPGGLLGALISSYFAFHRYNIIGEPPVNPAVQIGNELRAEEKEKR